MFAPDPTEYIFVVVLVLCEPQLTLLSDNIKDLTRLIVSDMASSKFMVW